MQISACNWQQIEAYLQRDDRCIFPIGSTEQHAQMSLCVDAILAEGIAVQAAEPLGIPVFPAMPYGITPYFMAYPGTITLAEETLISVLRDAISSVYAHGFRRILIVNGHGGNAPAARIADELMTAHPDLSIRFHSWYNAPQTWAKVQEIDPIGSHASWMENFPRTRLAHAPAPAGKKEMVDLGQLRKMTPPEVRTLIGDGNFGGVYQKDDATMEALWQVGVEETRELLEGPWPNRS